jgi:hypothetical protein
MAREALIRAGYDSAAAVKNAVSHLDDDPFAMAHWIVTEQTTAARLILGSRANAHFYIPFRIPLAIDATLSSVSTSLVAEGALVPERIPELARLLMRRGVVTLAALAGGLNAGGALVMMPFGRGYVKDSTPVLRILVLASIFQVVIGLASAIWRITRQTRRVAALEACLVAGLLGAAIPLAHAFGVTGVAVAWLAFVTAIWCAVLPMLVRQLRSAPGAGECSKAIPGVAPDPERGAGTMS